MVPTKYLDQIPSAAIFRMLKTIPFFESVLEQDKTQFKIICKFSKIFVAKPGEVIIRKGDYDSWFYFVLKGNLLIYQDMPAAGVKPIGIIHPGGMVGEMALMKGLKRSANVIASRKSPKILLLGTDFSPFGEMEDVTNISLHTKLIFFRSLIDVILNKLQNYKGVHPLKQTMEELKYLNQLVNNLSDMLFQWGSEVSKLTQKYANVKPKSRPKGVKKPQITPEQSRKLQEIEALLAHIHE